MSDGFPGFPSIGAKVSLFGRVGVLVSFALACLSAFAGNLCATTGFRLC